MVKIPNNRKWKNLSLLQKLFHIHKWKPKESTTMYSTKEKCVKCGKVRVDHDVYV